jgi:hypothetical protein
MDMGEGGTGGAEAGGELEYDRPERNAQEQDNKDPCRG